VHDLVTVALQTYLDRTRADLEEMARRDIAVRLVKGAYVGDTTDFPAIQERFLAITGTAIAEGRPFSVGTHDPDLVARLRELLADQKYLVEFGFLMGLADQTKLALVADGWSVVEYIPFGPGGAAYTARREAYVRNLHGQGRLPVP
jgi:proline dehydrogenase